MLQEKGFQGSLLPRLRINRWMKDERDGNELFCTRGLFGAEEVVVTFKSIKVQQLAEG